VFATLLPLCVFVVPMQAYQSMRLELRGGIVEQLLLSRLRPRGILLGKLQAALVQFVLFVAVLAPTMATSYLLRGVDLPTIAISLGFAALLCVVATMFAISSAAQSLLPALQGVANLGIAFGLGMAAFGLVIFVASGEYAGAVGALLRSGEFPAVASAMVLGAGFGALIAGLAAQSFLLHAFENRSTGFRLTLFALPVVAIGWAFAFLPAGSVHEVCLVLAVMLLFVGILFGVFMVTEQRELSQRVRAHVPKSAWRALLVAPLLPGRDRGTLCFVLFLLLLGVPAAVLAAMLPGGFGRTAVGASFALMAAMAAAYALAYFSIARFVRSKLPPTIAGNNVARVLLPVILLAFIMVPILLDVFGRGSVRWHWLHVMNPFWTIERFAWRSWRSGDTEVTGIVVAALVALLVLQLPACWRGIAEVRAAAAARRASDRA
jgi:hypothetical protein